MENLKLTALLLMLGWSGLAIAQTEPPPVEEEQITEAPVPEFRGRSMRGMDRRPMTTRMPRARRDHGRPIPDLTEEQEKLMENLQVQHVKSVKSLQDQLAEKQVRLDNMTTTDPVDMKAVNSLIEEIGKLRIELAKKDEAHRQEIRRLLTDKQRLVFDSRHGHRMGRGGR